MLIFKQLKNQPVALEFKRSAPPAPRMFQRPLMISGLSFIYNSYSSYLYDSLTISELKRANNRTLQ